MRWLCALLAAFWTTVALADLPAEPEAFSALEQRFTLFELTLQEARDSFDWISPQTDTAMKLRGDYLRLSRAAPPEWQVASLYRAANVLERLADALDAAKIPPAFSRNDELVAAYRDALDEKSGALRHEARLGYDDAAARAERLGVHGLWIASVRKGQRRLGERPTRPKRKRPAPATPVPSTGPGCGTDSDCDTGYLCAHGTCQIDGSE